MSTLHGFLFQVYPYVCFAVFLIGSLIRFDQNQYSWKSDSSQMLRSGLLRWGSNLFHFGVLFLFFGHMVGLFTPHSVYGLFMSAATKQLLYGALAEPDPDRARDVERAVFQGLGSSDDCREALAALAEKRPARWRLAKRAFLGWLNRTEK